MAISPIRPHRPGRRWTTGSRIAMLLVGAMVFAACSSGDTRTADTTTTTATTPSSTAPVSTTSTVATTTTTSTTITTTTTVPQTALEQLGVPVSDDWVVETVVPFVDSGTGGLAIDSEGSFYQGDFGYQDHVGDRIHRIDSSGEVTTFSQSDLMESLTMTYIAGDGVMYQSSYSSDTVFRIEPDGTPVVIAEGIRGPTGIAKLDDGTLIVEAFDSSTIHRIAPDGTITDWVFDRRFGGINGLTMGPDGTLYVIAFKNGQLFTVTPDGTVEKLYKFPKATAHGVYHDGSLFVTSRLGYVVFRYDLATGEAEIIAGNAEPGDADGRGSEASFGRPNAIAVGPDGSLYFNHGSGASNDPVTIRRIRFDP